MQRFLTWKLIFPIMTVVMLASAASMALANPHGPAYAASGGGAATPPSISGSGQLTYHGGPVMAGTAHVYLIFWEPSGHGVTPGYNQLIERYFQGVSRKSGIMRSTAASWQDRKLRIISV